MAAVISRAPTHLQPRLKAIATSNTSSQSAGATRSPTPREPTPGPRLSSRHVSIDPLSDKATISLIRRTLCPSTTDKNATISTLLPPLSSRNDVDLQLYAIIAIIIKEFVFTWYSKITPDQRFVEEVVLIIAHCTRGLEQRLRKVDLEALIFDELPELLHAHLQAYRTAFYPLHTSPLDIDPRTVYHSLCPSPALSPVPNDREPSYGLIQLENEAAYRQLLVQGVLAVLLPTEDLENGCLTALVDQIFSEMIIGNGLAGKACEPWLLWEAISKVADIIEAQMPKSKAQLRADKSTISLDADTRKSSASTDYLGKGARRSIQRSFWLFLQYVFLAFTTLRFMAITLATSSSLPSRLPPHVEFTSHKPLSDVQQPPHTADDVTRNSPRERAVPLKQPILTMKIWPCLADLLDLHVRMPWLSTSISMLQWCALRGPGEIGYTGGIIDKLMSHAIYTRVLDASLISTLLRSARAALFPNNAPGPPRISASPEEALRIRRQCAEKILNLIPKGIQSVFFGPNIDRRVREVEEVLDVFGDVYCNKHLMYGVVELVVVRLIPEMAEKSIKELLEERLS